MLKFIDLISLLSPILIFFKKKEGVMFETELRKELAPPFVNQISRLLPTTESCRSCTQTP